MHARHSSKESCQSHPAPGRPQLSQFYTAGFHPDIDYRRVQQARQRVAQITATAQAAMAQLEAEAAAAASGPV